MKIKFGLMAALALSVVCAHAQPPTDGVQPPDEVKPPTEDELVFPPMPMPEISPEQVGKLIGGSTLVSLDLA